MVDFILLTFFVLTFVAGFWIGKTFLTVKAATTRAKTIIRGWFA